MKCDRCGKPSVYHSTVIVNGVSQTTNLCRDCAIKEGVFSAPTSLFDDMFSVFSDFLPFEKVAEVVCPACKTSLREFKSTGKLGCPTCYDAFSNEIESIVKRIAPFDHHKQGLITSKDAKKESKTSKITKEDKIAKLKQDMALAVKEERYEDAGKIKKQIQKLESKDE